MYMLTKMKLTKLKDNTDDIFFQTWFALMIVSIFISRPNLKLKKMNENLSYYTI